MKENTLKKPSLITRLKKTGQNKKSNNSLKKQSLITRLKNTGQLQRLVINIIIFTGVSIFLLLALFSQLGILKPLIIGDVYIGTSTDFIIFAILIGTGIYGINETIKLSRIRKINHRFPDFVRDLSESRRAGMTFTKAIMHASKGNYGVLTPEIQQIARQISWGSSVEDALSDFAKRVNTRLINRTISLIIEASKGGGNVADVLEAASRDAREIRHIESERKATMMTYVVIIYMGLSVFLLIVVLICVTLLPNLTGANTMSFEGTISTGGPQLTEITSIFFACAIVQSLGMGTVAGVFENGEIQSGAKHIFLMGLITWVIFKLLVVGV
jgi:flagellar protein FlaJ